MKLFAKKQEQENWEKVEESSKFSSSDMQKTITLLTTRIEKLESKSQAESELRAAIYARIDSLSEQIGEIRELFKVLSNEKRDLDVQFGQVKAIVEKIQPKEILTRIESVSREVEKTSSKFDLVHKQYDAFKKDFNTFSDKLKVFKGEEELLNLQSKVKKELFDAERMANQVSSHASKFETSYLKLRQVQNEAKHAVEEFKSLKKEIDGTLRDASGKIEKLDEFHEATRKESLAELHQVIDEMSELMATSFSKLKSRQNELTKQLSQHQQHVAHIPKLKNWVAYLASKEIEAKKINEKQKKFPAKQTKAKSEKKKKQ